MKRVNERIAYVKGLADGLDISESSPEGRVLTELISVLDDLSKSVSQLQTHQEQVEEYLAAIDEDLTDLENDYYEDDYESDRSVGQDLDDDLEELGYVEMHCPNCNETVYVDQDFFEDDDIVEVLCPECNETILVNDDAPALTALDGE